jgi:hypothetical protein
MFGANKITKLIEQNFRFLVFLGFSVQKYSGKGDIEVCYSKKQCKIRALYYEGIDDNFRTKSNFSVTIEENERRNNILNCSKVFGKEKIDELNFNLKDRKATEQVVIYADFINKNIALLLI